MSTRRFQGDRNIVAPHPRRWHRRRVTPPDRHALSSLAALLLAACQAPPSTTANTKGNVEHTAPAPTPTTPTPTTPQPPRASPPPPPLGATRVYLVSRDPGDRIVRFDQHGAASLPTRTSSAIQDLFEGPHGTVYVRDREALYQVEGEQLLEVVRFPAEIGSVHHIALGLDDSMWVVADQGIGPRIDDAWQLTPLTELELDSQAKLAFDSELTLWAVAPRRALYRENDRWLPAPLELLGAEYTLLNPLGSPVGRVHVSNDHLLTRLGKTNFDSVVIDGKTRVPYTADLDLAPDGYACVATQDCNLACANAIPPTIIWRFPAAKYACTSVDEIAVEASHRVWVASSTGLSLILPDRDVHEFTVAEHPLLAGPITHMVVAE